MAILLKNFDQYWQTRANIDKKLVPLKFKSKAVILNYVNKEVQKYFFEPPESEELIEERACILASDIGLPFEWAYAVVKLRNIERPKNIPVASWLDIKNACSILYANNFALLKTIIAHDWSLYDIYGCANNAPCISFNDMGLLLLLKPTDTIIEITKGSIKIQTKAGSAMSFYKPLFSSPSRVLLYS